MERFGLIGHPISGSLSPALFTAGYGGVHPYDLIEGDDFSVSWQKFLDGYRAINVTAPFKQDAFEKVLSLAREGMGTISGPCLKCGATNLVVKKSEGLFAYNSDFTGIILSVAQAYFPGIVEEFYSSFGPTAHIKVHQWVRQAFGQIFPYTPQALVIGCGGAGRAAAVAASEMGFQTSLMNRTPQKAQQICDSLPEYGLLNIPFTDFRGAVRECDLVIYTIPVAVPQIATLTEDDFEGEDIYENQRPSKVILEANYKTPSFSGDVAQKMQKAGCQGIGGRQWLLYQALTGYSLMCGESPSLKDMEAVLR